MRVSDADRDQAVALLQTAFAEGRLTHAELDQRIGEALTAKSGDDITRALRGLPVPRPDGTTTPERAVPNGAERMWALVAHWSGYFSLFVIPALIALTKGSTSRFVRDQAMEAANFQLTFLGTTIVLGMATGVTFGLLGVLFPVVVVGWMALVCLGGLSAGVGNRWRYPWNVRLFR
jgi:uncharacterized Tic20 family protein